MGDFTLGVLLAFYLGLVLRPDWIRRQPFYLLGVGAMALALAGGMLSVAFLVGLGQVAAFLCGWAACYGDELPVNVPGLSERR